MNITGGSTDNYILTGLLNGTTYNISILATSEHFFSDSVLFDPVELVAQCHTCTCIILHVHVSDNHAGYQRVGRLSM